jgi:hypothetical protein
MIESFLDVWRRFSTDESREPDFHEPPFQETSEELFLAALPGRAKNRAPAVPCRFNRRRRLRIWSRESFSDYWIGGKNIVKKAEKMSEGEWKSFAARAAYNEINRLFSEGTTVETIPLEEVHEADYQEFVEGYAGAEVFSLVNRFWQEICSLSLRQRRALLFHSQELIIHLLESGISDAGISPWFRSD